MCFQLNAETSRWAALVAGLWVLACGGLSYNFAIYSSNLKDSLGYSQIQIDLLGTAKDIGDNVGIVAGLLSSVLPPWALLLIGATLNIGGYSFLYLVAEKTIAQPPFWQVFLYTLIGFNSSSFFNTAALVTCVPAFNLSRGIVTGLLSAMIGLSGAIFTQVYNAVLAPNQVAFLLVAAVGPAIIALISLPFLQPGSPELGTRAPEAEAEESSNLQFLLGIFLCLAGYLMVEIVLSSFFPISRVQSQVITAGMLFIVGLTLVVPIQVFLKTSTDSKGGISAPAEDLTNPLLPPVMVYSAPAFGTLPRSETESSAAPVFNLKPEIGDNLTLLEGIMMPEFWLLFLAIICGAGSGLTAMNNLAQMGEAQGSADVKVAVSMVSIWNYLGRVIGGFFSEYLVRDLGLPRPVILVGCHAVMAVGHLMFAYAVPGSLYLGSLIVGGGFGTSLAMVPTIASELFGLQNLGMFFNVFTSALPVGSYLFSGLLAGYIYDREAAEEAGQSGGGPPGVGSQPWLRSALYGEDAAACHGAHCFQLTFILMAVICLVAACADTLLGLRTIPVYHRLYPRGDQADKEEIDVDILD